MQCFQVYTGHNNFNTIWLILHLQNYEKPLEQERKKSEIDTWGLCKQNQILCISKPRGYEEINGLKNNSEKRCKLN